MPQVFLGLFRHLRYILLLRVARPAHQSPKVGAFLHDADPLCEPVIQHASSRHTTPLIHDVRQPTVLIHDASLSHPS
jgi:hypothetical protein